MRGALIGLLVLLASSRVQAQLAPANENGVTFSHVHLSVTDVELHKTLWTDLFGGALVEESGFTWVQLPGTLIFFTERESTVPSVGTAVDHFGFKVRNLLDVLARWRSRGYEVDAEWMGGEGFPQAYITMPDGARVELTGDPGLSVVTEMHHVHFYSTRHREMLAWYLDILGGMSRVRGTIETTMDVPGTNLSFSEAEGDVAPTQGAAVDHVGFEVDDLKAFASMLEGKGVEFQVAPTYIESLDTWVAFFTDPAGARIELSQGLDRF